MPLSLRTGTSHQTGKTGVIGESPWKHWQHRVMSMEFLGRAVKFRGCIMNGVLGGCFKYVLFSPLFREDSHFHYSNIFQMGWNHQLEFHGLNVRLILIPVRFMGLVLFFLHEWLILWDQCKCICHGHTWILWDCWQLQLHDAFHIIVFFLGWKHHSKKTPTDPRNIPKKNPQLPGFMKEIQTHNLYFWGTWGTYGCFQK